MKLIYSELFVLSISITLAQLHSSLSCSLSLCNLHTWTYNNVTTKWKNATKHEKKRINISSNKNIYVCGSVCTSHWFYVLKIIVFVHRRSHSLVYLLHIFFLLVLSSISTNLRLHFVAVVLHLHLLFYSSQLLCIITHSLPYIQWVNLYNSMDFFLQFTDETTKNKIRDRKYKVKKQQKCQSTFVPLRPLPPPKAKVKCNIKRSRRKKTRKKQTRGKNKPYLHNKPKARPIYPSHHSTQTIHPCNTHNTTNMLKYNEHKHWWLVEFADSPEEAIVGLYWYGVRSPHKKIWKSWDVFLDTFAAAAVVVVVSVLFENTRFKTRQCCQCICCL